MRAREAADDPLELNRVAGFVVYLDPPNRAGDATWCVLV